MSNIWFTADTHFGHQRILELSKRPFKTVEEMNNTMIENWNRVVGKDDTVYHLGDFGDYEFAKYLNGNIKLLFGNYERDEFGGSIPIAFTILEQNGFNNFSMQYEMIKSFNDKTYSLVHEPNNGNPNNFKLFGHIHKLQMVKRNALNVGVDCHNFTPISIETVEFYRNAIENHYDEEVFSE